VNGEKMQWLFYDARANRFGVTGDLTVEEADFNCKTNWHRPIVTYETEEDLPEGGKFKRMEVRDTGYWHEAKRKIDEMQKRNGVRFPDPNDD